MAKSNRVAIKRIGIEIGDAEHDLSLEQARALRDALDDLLGERAPAPAPIPYPCHYPVAWPRRPWEGYWTVTWGDSTGGAVSLSAVDGGSERPLWKGLRLS